MDPNELLVSTRAEFMRVFQDAVHKALPRAMEALYRKADASYTSVDQRRLLSARSFLHEKRDPLQQQVFSGMEHLLNRSFQTTYNTFRPSPALAHSADALSLLDASAFEDELRINDITKRFRSEAEEQLRDLNIRIALLFDQDNIKERENPFRPYLFARCIASAIESFQLAPELNVTLIEQLGDSLAPSVAEIYGAVNAQLARHGVAAQLQLKIKKAPDHPEARGGEEPAPDTEAYDERQDQGDAPSAPDSPRGYAGAGRPELGVPGNRVEQLFQSVRGMASGFAARHAGGEASPSENQVGKMSWLSDSQAVGGMLRKFFGGTGSSSAGMAAGATGAAPAVMPVPDAGSAMSGHTGAYGGTEAHSETGGMPAAGVTFNPGQPYSGAFHVGGSSRLTSAVHHMQRQVTPDTGAMVDQHGEVRNLILEQRGALNEMTQSVDEQMTIDIVAMLFEFILRDSQVPAEVRAQLGRLQFLVLKIALRDTSLLTQKGHPARLLVNRIGSISLGLKQLDPSGANITEEICRIVETLLCDESENPALFSRMLDEFDAFIARELRAGDQNVERTVEVVEQAQNRTLRFAHTTAQMAEALSRLTIDPYLQEFLETAWVQAIELAERSDAKRSRRYRLMVPDLLWTIVPKVREEDRSQLFALLPILLNTLREGLSLIGWENTQQQSFLNWLVDAHTSALRAGHAQIQIPSLPAIHEHFHLFVNNPDAGIDEIQSSGKVPDTQEFLQEAIRDLDLKVRMLDAEVDQELPPEPEAAAPEEISEMDQVAIRERLLSGVALEVNLGGRPSRGCLTWVNPNLSNLILSLDGQPYPSILSVRVFRRMLDHGRVRFIEAEPLFERAVQSLLKSADEMDGMVA